MNRTGLLGFAVATAALLLATLGAWGGHPPAYHYGEQWWDEYDSDRLTELLLHFGPPQIAGRTQVKKGIDDKQKSDLLDPDPAKPDDARDKRLPGLKLDVRLPPVDESSGGPTTVFDYSDHRRRIELLPGFSVAAGAGRFGGGLVCSGTGALRVTVNGANSIETWVKVAGYPKNAACIFSLAKDESRLLLLPDGRLELRLKNPHGIFDPKKTSPELIEVISRKNAQIISLEKLPLNTWTHVIIRKVFHSMEGGGPEPWDARLLINGQVVAGYMSERYNLGGDFFGTRDTPMVIGNSAAGGEGFSGVLDEIRICSNERVFYERPLLPWRDLAASRPLQFNKPWFRGDSTAFHVSFDKGLAFDRDAAGAVDKLRAGAQCTLDLKGQSIEGLLVEGIRGKALGIDPEIGLPRVPFFEETGMSTREGALEFWLRPVNWDDVTGYWAHTQPIEKTLSVARLYARNPATGKDEPWLSVGIDRAHDFERERVPVDPGHWMHLTVNWRQTPDGKYQAFGWIDGQKRLRVQIAPTFKPARVSAAYVEFGVDNKVTVKNDEPPRVEIDEVVGYSSALEQDEAVQACARWAGKLEPIPLYQASFLLKYSLQKLEFTLRPLLPETEKPVAATVALVDVAAGKPALPPQSLPGLGADGQYHFVLNDGAKIPFGSYRFDFSAADNGGREVLRGTSDWKFEPEPWAESRDGILDLVPPPWTPIAFDGKTLSTRMTRYALSGDGLPAQIVADGTPLLTGPCRFLEDGSPLPGAALTVSAAHPTDAQWQGVFHGKSCDVRMDCRAEYDGMIRFELHVKPAAGQVSPLRFEIPLKSELATYALWYPMGARGVSMKPLPGGVGRVLSSQPAGKEGFGFWGHCDLNDRNRGLWWFCDNAAGWQQSTKVPAIEIVRDENSVVLRLNLVAEPCAYATDRPIVFAILPHPARPLPDKYRLFERVAADKDARACSIFDAFMAWPLNPRSGEMKLYPAPDPARPDAGPSWEYAESCIPSMKGAKPAGYRTMYLSRAWFSCRAGAYDNWEWRSGESGAVALTPRFNNYLCWEMNQWLKRGIFNAVYLDECYETPARNLEAGFSVRLPDGTEQAGVTNFAFRDLMKRWRNLFHQNGLEPMLLAHHTYSFQYPGLLYCDAILDGENYPIVSVNSKDWIDSVPLHKYEVTQSGRMWGVTPFWMPFIAEGGFADKSRSVFPKWQWRMAREAQAIFAHFEIATVYQGQGAQVYRDYWHDVLSWGAANPQVPFIPYWKASPGVDVPGQGTDTLVSFYRNQDAPGGKSRLLLVASNLQPAARDIRITLDPSALGLRSGFAVKDIDTGSTPPRGDDFVKTKPVAPEPGKGLRDKENDPAALELDDDASKAAVKAKAYAPHLEGNTLVLPMRARDFRVLSIE